MNSVARLIRTMQKVHTLKSGVNVETYQNVWKNARVCFFISRTAEKTALGPTKKRTRESAPEKGLTTGFDERIFDKK